MWLHIFLILSMTNRDAVEFRPKRKKIMKVVNDDDKLVINSSQVVPKINERGKLFHKNMKDVVERMYRRTFHL